MFEQTRRLAEKLAATVSRRGFLGSLGGWAAAAAMGVAGVLTGTGTARADRKKCDSHCCLYTSGAFFAGPGSCHKNPCPPTYNGSPLQSCGAASPPLCDCLSW